MRLKIFLVSLLLFSVIITFSFNVNEYFYDAKVILRAVEDYINGINAYKRDELRFVYNPIVLKFFLLLNNNYSIIIFLIVLNLFSISTIFLGLYRFLSKFYRGHSISNSIIFISAYGFIFAELLMKLNITSSLHCILLGVIFLYFVERKKYLFTLFWIFLSLFSVIKPYFLAYSIGFLVIDFSKSYKPFLLALVNFGLLFYLIPRELYPNEFSNFIIALREQTINRPDGILDVGFSFYGFFVRLIPSLYALLLHILVLISIFFLITYNRTLEKTNSIFLDLLILCILANPRMMIYDFYFAGLLLSLKLRIDSIFKTAIVLFISIIPPLLDFIGFSSAGKLHKIILFFPFITVYIYYIKKNRAIAKYFHL
jgi:hypothetical protein